MCALITKGIIVLQKRRTRKRKRRRRKKRVITIAVITVTIVQEDIAVAVEVAVEVVVEVRADPEDVIPDIVHPAANQREDTLPIHIVHWIEIRKSMIWNLRIVSLIGR